MVRCGIVWYGIETAGIPLGNLLGNPFPSLHTAGIRKKPLVLSMDSLPLPLEETAVLYGYRWCSFSLPFPTLTLTAGIPLVHM